MFTLGLQTFIHNLISDMSVLLATFWACQNESATFQAEIVSVFVVCWPWFFPSFILFGSLALALLCRVVSLVCA